MHLVLRDGFLLHVRQYRLDLVHLRVCVFVRVCACTSHRSHNAAQEQGPHNMHTYILVEVFVLFAKAVDFLLEIRHIRRR